MDYSTRIELSTRAYLSGPAGRKHTGPLPLIAKKCSDYIKKYNEWVLTVPDAEQG